MRDNFRVNTMLAIPKTQRILQPAERYRVNLLVESTDPVAAAFRRIGVPRRYRDEQLVQQRGDSAAHALIVVAGRLRTLIPTADGQFRYLAELVDAFIGTGRSGGFGIDRSAAVAAAGPSGVAGEQRRGLHGGGASAQPARQ